MLREILMKILYMMKENAREVSAQIEYHQKNL